MTTLRLNGITLECVQGDIADQADMEAIVNAANAQLLPGGGVAGAIHRAAGPGLEKECRPLAPIQPGEAVITGGQNLPNKHVIHCLGPIYGKDAPADLLLANCYRHALGAAEKHGVRQEKQLHQERANIPPPTIPPIPMDIAPARPIFLFPRLIEIQELNLRDIIDLNLTRPQPLRK